MREDLIQFAQWISAKVESTGSEESIEPVLEALDAYRDGIITLAELQAVCLPEGLVLVDHIEAIRLAEGYMTLAEDAEEAPEEEAPADEEEAPVEEAEEAPFSEEPSPEE